MTTTAIIDRFSNRISSHPFWASSGMIAAVTAVGFVAGRALHPANLDILYLLAVFISALKWGRRPSIFTALVSTLVFHFCFIPPYFSFAISDLAYLVTLFGFVVIASITSELASRAHDLIAVSAARARAEAISKAKDEILNRISHELRAPLTAVLGWTQMLRQAGEDPERMARGLAHVEHGVELLARLASDLLDASRINSGKLQVRLRPTELAPIVSLAVDAARVSATHKNITVECSIDSVGSIVGDDHRIEEIVMNLLSNAIKFTPPHGRVNVRLSQAGHAARLVVSDRGAGIVPEFLPHVFEPFSQADGKNGHGGLGLGLSIVRNLVEAHGGKIAVASAGAGLGATFTVELPTTGSASNPVASPVMSRSDETTATSTSNT